MVALSGTLRNRRMKMIEPLFCLAPTGGRADQARPQPRGADSDREKVTLGPEPAGGDKDAARECGQTKVGQSKQTLSRKKCCSPVCEC